MAVLTITVDDAQVARVRDAYGVASNALLKTAIISEIKQKVIAYEVNLANMTSEQTMKAAAATAKTNADSISVT